MTKALLFPMLLAISVLAGCSSQDPMGGAQGSESVDQSPEAGKAPSGPARGGESRSVMSPVETNLSLTDCKAVFILITTPRDTIREPEPEPPEWERDGIEEEHVYDAYFCTRIGWDDLERGPVSFVVESSTITGVPHQCLGPEPGHLRYPHAIYTHDATFGSRFAAALDIDFYQSSIEVDPQPSNGGAFGSVSWQPGGLAESRATFLATVSAFEGRSPWSQNFVTTNSTTTVLLTIDREAMDGSINNYPGDAVFEEPNVASYGPTNRYPVQTAHSKQVNATGVITTWPEPLCGS